MFLIIWSSHLSQSPVDRLGTRSCVTKLMKQLMPQATSTMCPIGTSSLILSQQRQLIDKDSDTQGALWAGKKLKWMSYINPSSLAEKNDQSGWLNWSWQRETEDDDQRNCWQPTTHTSASKQLIQRVRRTWQIRRFSVSLLRLDREQSDRYE